MDAFRLFLIIIFVCSCQPTWSKSKFVGQPNVLNICLNVPEQQYSQANEAILRWNLALAKWQILKPKYQSLDCDIFVQETTIIPNTISDRTIAYTSAMGGKEIFLIKGRYEFATSLILMHELGHVFGAQHVNGTLMNPYPSGLIPECPDFITVLQVASWNHLDIKNLSYCY